MNKASIKKLYSLASKLNSELFYLKRNDREKTSRLRTRLYDLTCELGNFEKDWLEEKTKNMKDKV